MLLGMGLFGDGSPSNETPPATGQYDLLPHSDHIASIISDLLPNPFTAAEWKITTIIVMIIYFIQCKIHKDGHNKR